MKFIQLCMVVGCLVVSGTVYCDAEIEKQNEETEAILQRIKELESAEQKMILLIERKKDRHHKLTNQLSLIRECLKKERNLLGIPHSEPGKNWTKIIFASAGILTLTVATGGLAGGGVALLVKGSACVAAQLGGVAGGLVGAHGIGNSLSTKNDVDFDEVAQKTVPRAAMVGGVVGGVYAVTTVVSQGFDGGIGGAVAAYINNKAEKPDITAPQKDIAKNLQEGIRKIDSAVPRSTRHHNKACETA